MTRIDLRGLRCPLPVLKTRKALTRLSSGESIVVLCDDPLAGLDIPNAVRESGDSLVSQDRVDACWVLTICKG